MLNALLQLWLVAEVVGILAVAMTLRTQRRRALGEVLYAELADRRGRLLGLLAQAAALVLILVVDARLAIGAAVLIGPAALAWWWAPAAADQRCGTRGVQHGWDVRALEQLGAWRLTGDHLRFRVRGVWVAVALPRARHAELRTLLEHACPAGESAFRD